MKASYRKVKNGYYPVIIFNDKSRMTHRTLCLTQKWAVDLANVVISSMENQLKTNKIEDEITTCS
jgi:hypothetical protein